MFKVAPFFQKQFRKCTIPAYIQQYSFLPSGWPGLGPHHNLNPSSQNSDANISKNPSSCSSKQQFNSSYASEQGRGVDNNLIDSFRSLEKITLVRTRIVRKTVGFLHDSGIVVTEFEVLNEKGVKILDVEIQHGDLIEEYFIKIFDIDSDSLLCIMHLESDLNIKGLVLKITLPRQNLIGSVYEMKGMSKTTFIKNSANETIYQVFTHRGLGGFGWANSAKILNPEGNKKLGDLHISKQRGPDILSITINLPQTKENDILNKVLVLGCCLVLIKDN